jgi:hypothetical protein
MKLTKNRLKKLIKEEIMQEQAGNLIYIVTYTAHVGAVPESYAVFSTREKAEDYIANHKEDEVFFEVEEWEVDDPDPY